VASKLIELNEGAFVEEEGDALASSLLAARMLLLDGSF
jgi:hypothetical protein